MVFLVSIIHLITFNEKKLPKKFEHNGVDNQASPSTLFPREVSKAPSVTNKTPE